MPPMAIGRPRANMYFMVFCCVSLARSVDEWYSREMTGSKAVMSMVGTETSTTTMLKASV